jgi:hypothetical protein
MPAFVPHLVAVWAGFYSGSSILRTLVAFVHVAGLVSGGGAAVAADRATLLATRKGSIVRRDQVDSIHNTHRVVLIGLAGVIVSGLLLFAADVDTYAPSRLFWIKMAMVAALMVNGAVLVRVGRGVASPDEQTRRTMRWTASISLALWFLTTLAGAGLPNI